jgi:phosphonate transport system substrate-binding protein
VGPSERGEDRQAALSALAEAERRAGFEMQTLILPRAVDVVRAIGDEQCDAALLNVFAYLFARSEYGAKAILQVRRQGSGTYGGAILVREQSRLRSLRDLEGRTIAFNNPHSLSGFLLPAKLLRDQGIRFQPPVFTGNHAASLAALLAGQVDAATTFYHPGPDGGQIPLAETGVPRGTVRVLAVTESIPYEPLFVRRGLSLDARQRILRAFEVVAGSPQGKAALHGLAEIDGFAPARDDAYEPVARTIREAGKALEDLIPGAWRLSVRNRPSFDFWP